MNSLYTLEVRQQVSHLASERTRADLLELLIPLHQRQTGINGT